MHTERLFNTNAIDLQLIITSGILGSVVILISAFVFFIISILLIVRFLTFIILMITSPIGIAGGVFPQIKSTVGDDWWKNLTDQCMFAPVFFLMLWIVFKLMAGLNEIAPQSTSTASSSDTVSLILRFVIIIGLLFQALIISKKFSASGSGAITGGIGTVTGLAMSAGSWVGRKTVGKYAARGAENLRTQYQNMSQEERDGIKGKALLGKISRRQSIASASFDARNLAPKNSKLNPFLEAGIDAGKGTGAGGYSKAKADAFLEKAKEAKDKNKFKSIADASSLTDAEEAAYKKAAERNKFLGETTIDQKEAADEALKVAMAKRQIDSHKEDKTKLEAQRKTAAADLENAKEMSKSSSALLKQGGEKQVIAKEKEIKEIDKSLEKLNKDLTSSFASIKIPGVDPNDPESMEKAKKAVDAKQEEIVKKGGMGGAIVKDVASKDMEKLIELQKDVKSSQERGERIAAASLKVLSQQTTLAKQSHAKALYDSKWNRLNDKSKSAALRLQKEGGKSKEEKLKDDVIEYAKKEAAKDAKETGASESKPAASTPAPRSTPPAPVHTSTPPATH